MARRIRPKVRDKPKQVRDKKGRIKIRMRRESSDLLQLALASAKKEASKSAGFKGFKSGVKSATNKAKEARGKLLRELDREREAHRRDMAKMDVLTTAVERVVMAGHVSTDAFASHGVQLERYKNRREAMYRWRVVWTPDATATQAAVLRDEDGVDRATTVMQRHRLHPGGRIRVAEMAEIWASVTDTERPTIDPMQGMRGAWYYNARRYSGHSSAMNAWRRIMHERAGRNVAVPDSPVMTQEQTEALEARMRRAVRENSETQEPVEMTEDELEEEDCAPVARRRNRHAEARRIRNRLNLIFHNIGVRSCSFWERVNRMNTLTVRAVGFRELNSYLSVAAHFEIPLYDWDEESVQSLIASVNVYLECTQDGRQEDTSGLLSP